MRKKFYTSAVFILLLSGCFDSPEVQMVKGGTLSMCPDATVEQMVNSFISQPSWESGVTEGGIKFVNIEGGITFQEKPVTAAIQFMLGEGSSFEFNAFEINDLPQMKLMALGLMNKMCDSATK